MISFDDEEILWQGVVNKNIYRAYIILWLIPIILFLLPCAILLGVFYSEIQGQGTGTSYIVSYLIFALTILLGMFISIASLKKKKYMITNKRICVESGILIHKASSIDIKDISGFDYMYTFLDKIKSLDTASIDFSSPSIHTQSYYPHPSTSSKFAFKYIGRSEAVKVVNILKELKNKAKQEN